MFSQKRMYVVALLLCLACVNYAQQDTQSNTVASSTVSSANVMSATVAVTTDTTTLSKLAEPQDPENSTKVQPASKPKTTKRKEKNTK